VLVIDYSGDRKDGTKTAHVGRQWLGRYGKTDNGVVTGPDPRRSASRGQVLIGGRAASSELPDTMTARPSGKFEPDAMSLLRLGPGDM
jgi:hypothetical protein